MTCDNVPCLLDEWDQSLSCYLLFDCLVQICRALSKLSFEEITASASTVEREEFQRAKVEAQILQETFDGVEFLTLRKENKVVEMRASLPLFDNTTRELPPSIARGQSSKLTIIWSSQTEGARMKVQLPATLKLSASASNKLPAVDGNVSIAEYVPLVNKLFLSCGARRELILHLHENYLFGLLEWDLLEHSKALFLVTARNIAVLLTVRFSADFPQVGPTLDLRWILPSGIAAKSCNASSYGYDSSWSCATTCKRMHERLLEVLAQPESAQATINPPVSQHQGLYTY